MGGPGSGPRKGASTKRSRAKAKAYNTKGIAKTVASYKKMAKARAKKGWK